MFLYCTEKIKCVYVYTHKYVCGLYVPCEYGYCDYHGLTINLPLMYLGIYTFVVNLQCISPSFSCHPRSYMV